MEGSGFEDSCMPDNVNGGYGEERERVGERQLLLRFYSIFLVLFSLFIINNLTNPLKIGQVVKCKLTNFYLFTL